MARTHSWTNVAPCLKTLLGQFNADYPQRKMTNAGADADGIWPSKLHSRLSPNSDHESGNALDIDDDLSGFDGKPPQVTPEIARLISEDLRCKYAIHDSVIYHGGRGRPYAGSNKHTGHLHISVNESMRNDSRAWTIIKEAPMPERTFYLEDADAPSEAAAVAFVVWAQGKDMKAKNNGNRVRCQGDEEQTRVLVEGYFKQRGFVMTWDRVPVMQHAYKSIGAKEPVPVSGCNSDALKAAFPDFVDNLCGGSGE